VTKSTSRLATAGPPERKAERKEYRRSRHPTLEHENNEEEAAAVVVEGEHTPELDT
jgi:hypothetical protein